MLSIYGAIQDETAQPVTVWVDIQQKDFNPFDARKNLGAECALCFLADCETTQTGGYSWASYQSKFPLPRIGNMKLGERALLICLVCYKAIDKKPSPNALGGDFDDRVMVSYLVDQITRLQRAL
jgi:hypothetical protein